MENQEKRRLYFQGGDEALEQLIEYCGLFYNRLPAKNKLQSWLIEARKNWRTIALENGGVDLSKKEAED